MGGFLLFAVAVVPVARADEPPDSNKSPALCGPEDAPEPGIQGDVPIGQQAAYNCGLTLLGELPATGPLQGSDHCAYVRSDDGIHVIDVSDPTAPADVGTVPTFASSETMRAVTTDERAVLASGNGVYDIGDCENPVVKGEINWLQTSPTLCCPHDIRVSHDATKVYASFGVQEADISDLENPETWVVTDHTCDVSAQYHPVHSAVVAATGESLLCDQVFFLRGQQSHGPDTNTSGTRLYVGGQVVVANGLNPGEDNTLRVLDLTTEPLQLLDEIEGPGHSVDWFRAADGREFVLHANEIVAAPQTSCVPHPRPSSLGWAHEAFITEVTGDELTRVSRVELAINKPENCQAKLESGQNTGVAYHAVDDPNDATFAMVSMGDAGLRVFDIRDPVNPREVAYFNHGPLVHAGVSHYDATRGLIYVPAADGFKVLQIQPQVLAHLSLDDPND